MIQMCVGEQDGRDAAFPVCQPGQDTLSIGSRIYYDAFLAIFSTYQKTVGLEFTDNECFDSE